MVHRPFETYIFKMVGANFILFLMYCVLGHGNLGQIVCELGCSHLQVHTI